MAENAELLSEPTAGVKHDSGKLRMDLVPPEAIKAMADVLTSGAAKYGDRNWEKGWPIPGPTPPRRGTWSIGGPAWTSITNPGNRLWSTPSPNWRFW